MANSNGRKVSSIDVAKLAGVSQATVSYVLNARPDQVIREETRQKVLEAARALGYQPNLAARAMVTGRSNMVAFWVPNSARSVFYHVIDGIMALSHGSGFHVVIVQTGSATRESLASKGLLSGQNVDGILALDARDLINDILDSVAQTPPIVSMGPAYSTRTDHVGVDLEGGSLTAVRHLFEQGCERVAFAGVHDRLYPGDPRFDAYMRATAEAGASPHLIALDNAFSDGGYRAARSAFATSDRPDGLFCWNDETAIGANRAFADLGLRVPVDVALVGSDGTRETEYAVPEISTMAQPFEEMCRLSWTYLMDRLADPDRPLQGKVLPMTLAKRASSLRFESTI